MNNNALFCAICGKQYRPFTGTWHDTETGIKKVIMACPDACAHGYHIPEYYNAKGFIENIKGINRKCVGCGEKGCHDID